MNNFTCVKMYTRRMKTGIIPEETRRKPTYMHTSILSLAGVSPRLIKYHANYLITTDVVYTRS